MQKSRNKLRVIDILSGMDLEAKAYSRPTTGRFQSQRRGLVPADSLASLPPHSQKGKEETVDNSIGEV